MHKNSYMDLVNIKAFKELCNSECLEHTQGFPSVTCGFWCFWLIFDNKVSDKFLLERFQKIQSHIHKDHKELLDDHGIIRIYTKKVLVLS